MQLVDARGMLKRFGSKSTFRRWFQGWISELLRHGKRYPGKCAWTRAYRRWLCDFRLDHPT